MNRIFKIAKPLRPSILQKNSLFPPITIRRNLNVFAEFTKSVKRQIEENKDFQQNVKSIGDETTRIAGKY